VFGSATCPHCGYRPIWFLGIRCYNCGKYTIGPSNWLLGLLVLLLGWGAIFFGALLIHCFGK